MCIRDRVEGGGRTDFRRARVTAETSLRLYAGDPDPSSRHLTCLLYTSGRCRRIERSPSRGLGDVYKRQGGRRGPDGFSEGASDSRNFSAALRWRPRSKQSTPHLSLIHIWTLPTNREESVSWARRCV